ncbi:deoxyribose-phosphate aldolase [Desulfofarcimen acetoxidans DSM 771]|uniref:Deoxyribose-phosphate aldolase n=1 Tax=Desulfofarcimen acetoxidans (strain ATCC 49208 / DSM 771 / KCTC 5769 / VKM B-1644 / 5575) TaxID=485916 RepID=C8W218_DESAS|nr:deoxyribose-phosphate aldolase [Desulfofarcimen acetoxidans DSM 771]
MKITKQQMAGMIDHTLLKPFAGLSQIRQLCEEAVKQGFASVCINPCHISAARELLSGTSVKVCTVIGFPLGAAMTDVKAFEAREAVRAGAGEIDMVINIGFLKDKRFEEAYEDILAVVKSIASVSDTVLLKVIIETCYLTEEEKVRACLLAERAGAHFVKTSTGFGTGGALTGDIDLMRRTVSAGMGIKASGGIKTAAQAIAVLEAGATRIGTSSGKIIIAEMD